MTQTKATHTRKTLNFCVIDGTAIPKTGRLSLYTNGVAWGMTDAWKNLCEAIVALGEGMHDATLVCVGPDASAWEPVQYSLGEIRAEVKL